MLDYKGLTGTLERLIVSDAQVDEQIDAMLEQNKRIIPVLDRPSQDGDELLLDYAGFCDGVQFEGGTAQDQTLVLGSNRFIPGFEEQLLGRHTGEKVEVRVTFPTAYHAEALAGKEALFQCRVKQIRLRQSYKPDDVFAREVGGFDSFNALREAMRRGLQAYADRQAEEELRLALVDQLAERWDGDVTPEQLKAAVDAQMNSLSGQLARQGLTLDAYCQFTGKTKQRLRMELEPDARRDVIRQSILTQIVEQEGIEADEDSVAEAIGQLCRDNNLTPDQMKPLLNDEAQRIIVRNVLNQKALQLIRGSAIIETVEKRAE